MVQSVVKTGALMINNTQSLFYVMTKMDPFIAPFSNNDKRNCDQTYNQYAMKIVQVFKGIMAQRSHSLPICICIYKLQYRSAAFSIGICLDCGKITKISQNMILTKNYTYYEIK